MSTSTTVNDLKINVLTKAQYDTSSKSSTELWMVTDDITYDVQTDTFPTASVDYLGKIYQYTGTTTASYTNGYFYKCVSDGAVSPAYSWEQINTQPTVDPLPSQAGQSGKYLTTNGTNVSWSTIEVYTASEVQTIWNSISPNA